MLRVETSIVKRKNKAVHNCSLLCPAPAQVLASKAAMLPPEYNSEALRVKNEALKAYPTLQNLLDTAPSEAFASDVEAEANKWFQQLYVRDVTVDQMVTMLKEYKSSPDLHKQEVFACMIHNLFDEYRCAGLGTGSFVQAVSSVPFNNLSTYAHILCMYICIFIFIYLALTLHASSHMHPCATYVKRMAYCVAGFRSSGPLASRAAGFSSATPLPSCQ